MAGEYRFSFGPWNIHEGADPFGPTVRAQRHFGKKLKMYKKLGFDGVQFHDDDAVPDMNKLSPRADNQKGQRGPQDARRRRAGGGVCRAEAVGGRADDRRGLYIQRPGLPRVCQGAKPADASTSPPPSIRS